MNRSRLILSAFALLSLAACDRAPAPAGAEAPSVAPAAAAPSVDAEFEQLKQTTPLDACALLTSDELKQVYPELAFELHQQVAPRMSGYVWDSRCTYWAGVGSVEYAKETPTHTVELFVATSASEAKARANLASRAELAVSTTGYQAQPALGESAYAVADTGAVSLFFVRGQSEVQINVSSLSTPNEQRLQQALALAAAL